uniref:hypothetical protein n=1 Tax=Gelidibacter sp. TaxID=2018083 RepID=UPI00404AB33F
MINFSNIKSLIYFVLLTTTSIYSQSQQKAEKEFLKQLNDILIEAPYEHWGMGDKVIISVDSFFSIKEGLLSSTIRYKKDDGSYILRKMVAPIQEMKNATCDLYLILEFEDDMVSVFESNNSTEDFKETERLNYFHIGKARHDEWQKQLIKLQKALKKVLRFYKT